jgi:hypothetical protein
VHRRGCQGPHHCRGGGGEREDGTMVSHIAHSCVGAALAARTHGAGSSEQGFGSKRLWAQKVGDGAVTPLQPLDLFPMVSRPIPTAERWECAFASSLAAGAPGECAHHDARRGADDGVVPSPSSYPVPLWQRAGLLQQQHYGGARRVEVRQRGALRRARGGVRRRRIETRT